MRSIILSYSNIWLCFPLLQGEPGDVISTGIYGQKGAVGLPGLPGVPVSFLYS